MGVFIDPQSGDITHIRGIPVSKEARISSVGKVSGFDFDQNFKDSDKGRKL